MRITLSAVTLSAFLVTCTIAHATEPSKSNLIAQGQYIATAADCAACHTAPDGGTQFAGGYAISSPLGNIISSNITPSKAYGIGSYTEEEFTRAIRQGVNKEGQHLYPAMPYPAYARMSDADVQALYAYLMNGVPAVDKPAPATELPFPFNIRESMLFWNLLFSPEPTPVLANSAANAEQLVRGAYLVNALEHCAECHTPRNFAMGLSSGAAFSGGSLGNWYAPNITPDLATGISSWSQADIVQYLKTGGLPGKAQAAGPMSEAVEHSLQHLSDSDLQAIAVYLKQVPPVQTGSVNRFQGGRTKSDDDVVRGQNVASGQPVNAADEPAVLYSGNCAACHTPSGSGSYNQFYPSLSGNSAVDTAHPDNLIASILYGVNRTVNGQTIQMPAFGPDAYVDRLSYAQVAELANYVLATYGQGSANLTAADVELVAQGGPKPALYYLGAYSIPAAIVLLLILAILVFGLVSRKKNGGV